ncbi:MAG: hypothetical protein ACLPVO_19695 [Desulfomonilaceae bacterium]
MTGIDKSYIERRVKEWKKRLESLYALVEKSLADLNGVRCEKKQHVTMYEGLMQSNDVSPKKLPVLDIYKNKMMVASFKPIGLWVVGANGRIDILTENGAYILVDKADYGQEPEWNVFPPQNRQSRFLLDSSFIRELIEKA